ncbi:hypothetical protein [Neorhizobium sp. LjRoot104]|uniref:hypothetical protein n=1 Tax=Neorhizobium sp. LjRoot104 TaxID=3342254 RepID=UPI003ECCFA4C
MKTEPLCPVFQNSSKRLVNWKITLSIVPAWGAELRCAPIVVRRVADACLLLFAMILASASIQSLASNGPLQAELTNQDRLGILAPAWPTPNLPGPSPAWS